MRRDAFGFRVIAHVAAEEGSLPEDVLPSAVEVDCNWVHQFQVESECGQPTDELLKLLRSFGNARG